MTYYALIKDNIFQGTAEVPYYDFTNLEITKEQYDLVEEKGNNYYIYQDGELVLNPNYEDEKAQKERQRLDLMTLTPADVERALYKAKGMDFEDLKQLIATGTGIDLKALAIEFRAKDFYRGAMFGNGRLFDVVGQLLDYTPEDIDYLFLNKELPAKEEPEVTDENPTDIENV